MKTRLKILLIEDVSSDVFLIERQFQKNKFSYDLRVVKDKNNLKEELINYKPDIVISDYNLNDFTGIEALSIVKEVNSDIPLIIVTGALDEETAVRCIKAGADDYLTKEKLTRLVVAVKSAIEKRNAIIEKEKERIKSIYLNRELQSLIRTVNTPIVRVDKNGVIKEWNLSAEKFFGYSKSEVYKTNFINKFILKENRQKLSELFNELTIEQNISNYELTVSTKNRKKKMLMNVSCHQNAKDEISDLTVIGQDITQMAAYRDELERQIEERTEKLRESLQKEKELAEMKSRFVSTASHEFRTPLAAIGFAAGFLKKYFEKSDRETIDKKLDKILNQVHHMADLLDDVLTVGKIQSNENLKFSTINFNEFTRNIIDEVLYSVNHSHEIKTTFSEEKIQIETDKILLRKIIINLFTNAIKFSPNKNQVLFDCKKKGDQLTFKIVDFGIGIPEDECKEIFIPFHRGKNTDTIQGTGLGLPIVSDALKTLGGKIKVESKPHIETTFTVRLPIHRIKYSNHEILDK